MIKVGDQVFASDNGQVMRGQRWAVGVVCHIYEGAGFNQYLLGPKLGKPWKNAIFPHAQVVGNDSARRIIRALKIRKPLFDQIWECLIAQHNTKPA